MIKTGGVRRPLGEVGAGSHRPCRLVAEAPAGALTGAGTVGPGPTAPEQQGVLIIAIDVDRFRPLADFTGEVESSPAHVPRPESATRDVPTVFGAAR